MCEASPRGILDLERHVLGEQGKHRNAQTSLLCRARIQPPGRELPRGTKWPEIGGEAFTERRHARAGAQPLERPASVTQREGNVAHSLASA